MTANQAEFVRLLGVYTSAHFDPYMLAGPAKASCRAHCMSAFAGVRVPQSKAGVTVIRDTLHSIFDAQGECLAAREDDVLRKIRASGLQLHRGTERRLEVWEAA